jgi:hypothetical protein
VAGHVCVDGLLLAVRGLVSGLAWTLEVSVSSWRLVAVAVAVQ